MKTDTLNRLHTLLAELHTDDTSTSSVWKVWNDGEITLEKGGAVYGCRNLHTMEPPVSVAVDACPVLPRQKSVIDPDGGLVASGYSCAIVATKSDAYRVRSVLLEILRS